MPVCDPTFPHAPAICRFGLQASVGEARKVKGIRPGKRQLRDRALLRRGRVLGRCLGAEGQGWAGGGGERAAVHTLRRCCCTTVAAGCSADCAQGCCCCCCGVRPVTSAASLWVWDCQSTLLRPRWIHVPEPLMSIQTTTCTHCRYPAHAEVSITQSSERRARML